MRTEVSNRITIHEPTIAVRNWIETHLTVTNPKFETLMRLGKEAQIRIYHISREMKLYVTRGDSYIIPFGCLYSVWPLIREGMVDTHFNQPGKIGCLNDKITQPLYDYQEEAVQKMVQAKSGILIGGCGSGKTNCAIEIIHRVGEKFLWLTHTKDLVKQTYKRFKSLYPMMDIGITGDGEVNFGRDGTIATIQTIEKLDPEIYADAFNLVMTDECFPAGTPIITKEGYKNIEDIKVGDYVLSFNHKTHQTEYKKVKHLFVKTSSMLNKICFNDKMLIATHNHPIYTQRGYVAAEDLKYGDYALQSVWEANNEKRILIWSMVESVQSYEQSNSQGCSGSCTVYNFEVEDNNNYFANDILVHNCHHISGSPTLQKMFVKVIEKIPARYKYGITASDKRNDSLTKTMYTSTGFFDSKFEPIWRIRKEDTKTLVAKHRKFELDTPFSYDMLNPDGTFNYMGLINYISENEERNKVIVDNIVSLCDEGRKQLVLCSRVDQCKKIHEMLVESGVNAVLLVGSVTAKRREKILSDHTGWSVIVATVSLAKEGLDIKELDTLHLVSCLGNKSDTVQAAGRIERICDGKKDPIVFDYVDTKIPYLVSRYKKRKGWLNNR